MDKLGNGNLAARKGAGRPEGSVNKVTAGAKAVIEEAVAELGGAPRLLAWAKDLPENERAFWTSIFPRLLPLQVNGSGPDGEFLMRFTFE